MSPERPSLLRSSRSNLQSRILELAGRGLLLAVTSASLIALLFIFWFIARDAFPFFSSRGLREFLATSAWYPSGKPAQFGALSIFVGSGLVTLGSIVFAVPIGITAAICLSDILPFSVRQVVKPVVEMLAAVPSVVYGFFALVVFAPAMQEQGGHLLSIGLWILLGPVALLLALVVSDLLTDRFAAAGPRKVIRPVLFVGLLAGILILINLLTARVGAIQIASGANALNVSIILGVMALPTIVSVSEDALQAVGREIREGSYALGATRAETLLKAVVPAAMSGILAAVILGVMRAIGETMVVWMASGNAAQIPDPWFNYLTPVRTLTATIAGDMGEADQVTGSDRYHVLFAMALCLLAIAFVMNLLSETVMQRQRRKLGADLQLSTRKMLNHAFTGGGVVSILLMAAALVVLVAPLVKRGTGAVFFSATVEHRRVLQEQFHRGDAKALKAELEAATEARRPVTDAIRAYEKELDAMPAAQRRKARTAYKEVREAVAQLLGPLPGDEAPMLLRSRYGQTRWDRALVKQQKVLFAEVWDYGSGQSMGQRKLVPRETNFTGTALAPLFPAIRDHLDAMLLPRSTAYWGFFSDKSVDAHFFGGIWPEILGTFYLTIGAMLFAVPLGVIAAIYLCEYARPGRVIRILRTCISTLAGVPSIVFGLFGLAFFINTLKVSDSKSVLAGSLTLALLILPTIIRASEEAILAVPRTYKEAALSLGGGLWHTIVRVILPAAMPGILTGIVISMGRAAGETAPIIFTAAVSVGRSIGPLEALSQPTPALPWNIYNICTEHEAVDEIRHVQYGMALTLIVLVLLLNLSAVILRARITRRLKG